MKTAQLGVVLIVAFFLSGCVTKRHYKTVKYENQINLLSKKLRKEKRTTQNLRDENIVLRQLAGVPEPAIERVKKDGKSYLKKVYSEKFLYKQVLKAFKKQDPTQLERSVAVFLQNYPNSPKADNAVYLQGLLELKTGNFAESLTHFDSVLERFPKANKKPAAVLGKGLAYSSLRLEDQATSMFNEVIKHYPDSPEAVRARRELKQQEVK